MIGEEITEESCYKCIGCETLISEDLVQRILLYGEKGICPHCGAKIKRSDFFPSKNFLVSNISIL